MNFSRFFSEQARKPTGLFGRIVMSVVFDKGNAFLNRFVNEVMSVQENDHILEIGFGTGKLIYKMAKRINKGQIEGIEFSGPMVSIAQKKNSKFIKDGRVIILEGNFEDFSFNNDSFTKICSVNTIYFWPRPETTANKVATLLKPGGKFVVAFEDKKQLETRNLDKNVFKFYSENEVKSILINAGFLTDVTIHTKIRGKSVYHCVVAVK